MRPRHQNFLPQGSLSRGLHHCIYALVITLDIHVGRLQFLNIIAFSDFCRKMCWSNENTGSPGIRHSLAPEAVILRSPDPSVSWGQVYPNSSTLSLTYKALRPCLRLPLAIQNGGQCGWQKDLHENRGAAAATTAHWLTLSWQQGRWSAPPIVELEVHLRA